MTKKKGFQSLDHYIPVMVYHLEFRAVFKAPDRSAGLRSDFSSFLEISKLNVVSLRTTDLTSAFLLSCPPESSATFQKRCFERKSLVEILSALI